jgi:hypothetical protein
MIEDRSWRMAVLRDPDGVMFAIGKFQPPE